MSTSSYAAIYAGLYIATGLLWLAWRWWPVRQRNHSALSLTLWIGMSLVLWPLFLAEEILCGDEERP